MMNVYPNRPVTLVVGFPLGDVADAIARELAINMSVELGQKVIVANRPGAAGNTAADAVAKAKPDGYTVYLAVRSVTLHEAMYEHIDFDFSRAFVPVGTVLKSNAEAHGWCALLAPKGIPAQALNRLSHAINSTLSSDDVRANLAQLGFDVAPPSNTPELLGEFLEEDTEKWTAILARNHIIGLQ